MAEIEDLDEIPWEEPKEKTDTIDKGMSAKAEEAVDIMVQKLADFDIRLINMANKLEEHLLTPDAHNPAMVARTKTK